MERLIKAKRSVIVACDVASLVELEALVMNTHHVEGIGGYKIGSLLVLRYGFEKVVNLIKTTTVTSAIPQPIIYDHQKGGTDIPELGKGFAKTCASGRVHAVILFPFGGAATEREWIKACQSEGLVVLVGGHMTQKEFLEGEGGFIAELGPERMYTIAAENGVSNFVVPGNKAEFVLKYRRLLEKSLGQGNFTLYAPGFIAQGGNISETGQAAGDDWHAIVGTAIYGALDIAAAAREMTSQILI